MDTWRGRLEGTSASRRGTKRSLSRSREPEQTECPYFKQGHCRDGPTCIYLHDIQTPSEILSREDGRGGIHPGTLHIKRYRPDYSARDPDQVQHFKDVREIDYWLANQHSLIAADNIEQLSGEKGLQVLSAVVHQRCLPSDTITQLVTLLVKEGIRSSLLLEKTNKIYGTLLRSPFLLQLQGHVLEFGVFRSPLPADVKPYLLLIEELQSRTADGWKEVPLDALQGVVLKLEESTGKAELLEIVSRLLHQRERLQRSLAVAPTDRLLQGSKFRHIPIVPGKEELLILQARRDLPLNRVGLRYSSISDYLETHFRLLREDFIDPLRQGVKAYRSGDGERSTSTNSLNTREQFHIYTAVRLLGLRCGDGEVEYVVSFSFPATNAEASQWESSKRLMFGALLCVSADRFQTFFWGVVSHRDVEELERGRVSIRILAESEDNVSRAMRSGQTASRSYVMVESPTAYFESYYHVLKNLVRNEMEKLPFTENLLQLEPEVKPPSYLSRRGDVDSYNFKSVFDDIDSRLGRSSLHILEDWPSDWASSLDKTQQDALKHGLAKGLAIIQGPPGTGKTFLGLLLVRILLANLKKSNSDLEGPSTNRNQRLDSFDQSSNQEANCDVNGPILVVCYTNHALDQFLEEIYRTEPNVVRIGGQGKSEKLKGRNLRNLVTVYRESTRVRKSHRRFLGRGRKEKDNLEIMIDDCIDQMGLKFVSRELLKGIATPRQIESLFSVHHDGSSRASNEVVRVWLKEEWCQDPSSALYFFIEDPSDPKSTLPAKSARLNRLRGRTKLLPRNELVPASRRQPNVRGLGQGPFANIFLAPDVWRLNLQQRQTLHEHWLTKIRLRCQTELEQLSQRYQDACEEVKEVESDIRLSLLREAKVIGMTTTAAARHFNLLRSLKSEVLIVEEAAEVLEGHILACLTSSVKHLILIGDHVQLRPSVAVNRLATEHNLDVSMFERLVRSGVEHVTLQEQRRMRPGISKLVKRLYPALKDHESVLKYDVVPGVTSSVFFFDHKAEEDQSTDAASKLNVTEAKLVVELCLYLLKQGSYSVDNITILAMYSGQLQQINRVLRERMLVRPIGTPADNGNSTNGRPRVSSVDDYQGEENDIIILSLVRSNTITTKDGVGTIGFLSTPNRICVALTRARKGLFIFGNAELLAAKSELWENVIGSLREDGALGTHLEVYCQNHPHVKTNISTAEDFKQIEDGGCTKPCEFQLECGHACPRRCHPGSHDWVVCPKSCSKLYDACQHQCKEICHGADDCPPCKVMVQKMFPQCGHMQDMPCSKVIEKKDCRTACPRTLQCGHPCTELCGIPCTKRCEVSVERILPCGHSASVECHTDHMSYSCKEPCGALLPDCSHKCQGRCGECKQGTVHIPCKTSCGRTLLCSHFCKAGCSLTCPPCRQNCRKRCFHSRCSRPCWDACTPCREPCDWQCEHFKCEKLCFEICTRPPCNRPCPKRIPACGHSCIGLCGEPCPTKCRICHPDTIDTVTLMALKQHKKWARFIQLTDCEHIFEVKALDRWVKSDCETRCEPHGAESVHMAVKLKECPECKSTIWRTRRYSKQVKEKLAQVEEVKKKINGIDFVRHGNLLLGERMYIEALSAFRKALQQNPELMEAHLGTGYAFFHNGLYVKAMAFFSFVVEKSSFRFELDSVIKNTCKLSRGHAGGSVEELFRRSSSRASTSVATKALVQWASALTEICEFSDAIKLCNAILAVGRDPGNRLALKIKESAEKGEVELVVQAMAEDVGTRGQWYRCPNGHFYAIGECGGAVKKSCCPDCNAQVGGDSHKLLAGNNRVRGS